MRDQKTKGKSQGQRGLNQQRATDALSVTAVPSGDGQITRGGGKRQLTRADDDRVYYTTLRQAAANKSGKGNGRNKGTKAGSGKKRATPNGAVSNRKNSRGKRF
ncbi:MAG: hypothetical protein DWQ05_00775 [Calditrichaeota bacterium]|nr:MAG: hypothetical protein DWQ05_00775 [Calditrichota bacterium]